MIALACSVTALAACASKRAGDPLTQLWMASPYTRWSFVVADPIPEAWLVGAPHLVDNEPFAAERTLTAAAPPSTLVAVGDEVELGPTLLACRSRVVRIRALARLSREEPRDAVVGIADPTKRAARIWKLGHPTLVAEMDERPGCGGMAWATPPDLALPMLQTAKTPSADLARAREAMRAHSIWQLQEDVYQASLTADRQYRESSGRTLWNPPRHWDEGAPSARPEYEVRTWQDDHGARLHVVRTGNHVACAVPPIWAVWDADFQNLLRWERDDGREPLGFVDLDRDGTWEVVIGGNGHMTIERLAAESGGPLVLRGWAPFHPIDCENAMVMPPDAPDNERDR